MFHKATKEKAKLRLALMGPSGSGKTYTALSIGTHLGKRVAVIDSERASASKYADIFQFDSCELDSHSPETYVKAIREAEKAGYDVLIIDSLSHAWMGRDGALELVDKSAKRTPSGNSFAAWRDVTPLHNALVDAIINAKCHVVATMRTKQEYVLEENEKGRKVPRKVGMAPIQRDGVEYEFDVVADLNLDHDLIVAKTRCAQADGLVIRKPGQEFAELLKNWLDGGEPAKPKTEPPKPEKQPEAPKSAAASVVSTPNAPASAPAPAGATLTSDHVQSGDKPDAPGPEQMQQLLKAGTDNGWKRPEISAFVCHAFKLTPKTIGEMTWKQWETAIKVVSHKLNANGVVVVSGSGAPLPEKDQWIGRQ